MHIPFTVILVTALKCASRTTQGLVVFHKHPPPSHAPVSHCKTHTAGKHKHTHTLQMINNHSFGYYWLGMVSFGLWFGVSALVLQWTWGIKVVLKPRLLLGFQASPRFSCNIQGFAQKAPLRTPRKPWAEQKLFCQLHLTAQNLPSAKALTCRSCFLPSLYHWNTRFFFKIKLI